MVAAQKTTPSVESKRTDAAIERFVANRSDAAAFNGAMYSMMEFLHSIAGTVMSAYDIPSANDDVVNISIFKIWMKRDTFVPGPNDHVTGTFKAWAATIVTHTATDVARQHRRRERQLPAYVDKGLALPLNRATDERTDDDEKIIAMMRVLPQFNEVEQRVMRLLLAGCSQVRIAEIVEMDRGWVQRTVIRLRNAVMAVSQ